MIVGESWEGKNKEFWIRGREWIIRYLGIGK